MRTDQTLRTCSKGHKYYKSSGCLTCPTCEAEKNPKDGFLSLLSAPAQRALENNGITTIQQLSNYSEKDLMKLHGFGKSSMPLLRTVLDEKGLTFKQ
jgi:DNA-directed RNA polymerase alpha subunit